MSTLTTEEKLDEALKQTFPASDAFSLSPTGSSDELRPEYKRSDFGSLVRGRYAQLLRAPKV